MGKMKQLKYQLYSFLSRFMYGRNGFDNLAKTSYIIGIVLLVIQIITGIGWFYYLEVLLFGYSLFRAFSKNIPKRYAENQKFMEITRMPRSYFNMTKLRIRDRKVSRYYMCGKCHQQIRVPRGKGKIEITCPKCRNKFIKKT